MGDLCSRGRRALAVLAFGVVVLAGCGASPEDVGDPVDRAPRQVRSGGEVTLVSRSVRSLDPSLVLNNSSQGGSVLNAIYDVLFTVDPGTGALTPHLAEDFTSEDGLTWTLTLREGVTFSDGAPFDADAVAFNWDRVMTNPRAPASSMAAQISSVTVAGPTTLSVRLDRVNRQFHRAVETSSLQWIASPTTVREGGESWADEPVGAGPFVMTGGDLQSEVTMAKNPSYWQAPSGLPRLDQLTYRFINDPQSAADTVVTGAADGVLFTSNLYAEQIVDGGGTQVDARNWAGANNLLFNKNRAPFDDPRARRAVTLALDVNQMFDVVQQGADAQITSIIDAASELHDPELVVPRPDRNEAQRLLDELASEGKRLEFSMAASAGTDTETVMKQFQAQLTTFENVTASIRTIDPAEYGLTLFAGDFDLAGYAIATPDPEPQWQQLASDFPIPIARLESPEADALLAAGRGSTSVAERRQAYSALQELMLADWAFVWLNRSTNPSAYSSRVHGAVTYGSGSQLVDGFGLVE